MVNFPHGSTFPLVFSTHSSGTGTRLNLKVGFPHGDIPLLISTHWGNGNDDITILVPVNTTAVQALRCLLDNIHPTLLSLK
jgi:hypothetical protein